VISVEVIMLYGDNENTAKRLLMHRFDLKASCLPEDKLKEIKNYSRL
jgi:cation transport ATPase